MAFCHCSNQHIAPERSYRYGYDDSDIHILLCMRPDMCTHMVSLQAHYEKQVLHHLPNIQLGPSDDVPSVDNDKQFLRPYTRDILNNHMDYMGSLRIGISREILGKEQYGSQMLRVYRQAVHPVLQKTA